MNDKNGQGVKRKTLTLAQKCLPYQRKECILKTMRVLTLAVLLLGAFCLPSVNTQKAYAYTTGVKLFTNTPIASGYEGSYYNLGAYLPPDARITRVVFTMGPSNAYTHVDFGYSSEPMAHFEYDNLPTKITLSYSPTTPVANLPISQYCWNMTAYLTEIDYQVEQYSNVSITTTPEKYVAISWNRDPGFPESVVITNNTTGQSWTISPSANNDLSSYTFIDNTVIPGKTYSYSLKSFFTYVVPGNIFTTSNTIASNLTITVPDNAMLAMQAAQAAEQAANNAANAANAVNTIVNSTLTVNAGVVQDSSGTVLSAARQARDAANQTNTAVNNLSNKIDSNQQALLNQLSNLQTSVTNNFNNLSNLLPPVFNGISGVNGATATRSSSFAVSLDYSNATQYRYSVDNGAWSNWSPLGGNQISVPLSSVGVHTITVQIRNGSNDTAPTAQKTMTVFKL